MAKRLDLGDHLRQGLQHKWGDDDNARSRRGTGGSWREDGSIYFPPVGAVRGRCPRRWKGRGCAAREQVNDSHFES